MAPIIADLVTKHNVRYLNLQVFSNWLYVLSITLIIVDLFLLNNRRSLQSGIAGIAVWSLVR